MAYKTEYGNYVKFLRGTPTAWDSIETKDADTLYFIAEQNAKSGKLYLGNKLIADGDTAEINTLGELTDVVISAGVPNGAVLAYDSTTKTWRETLLESILSDIIGLMQGATADDDGVAGLVPQPVAGQQGLFLRGDGSWADPTESLREVVSSLDKVVQDNQKAHTQDMATLMGGRGELVPVDDIVSEHINALVGAAPETFDTLEELAKWVTEHDEAIDIASTLTRLSKVETSLFDVDTGLVNRVGDIELILNGEGATQGLVAQTAKLISDMIIANNNILDLQDITETHDDKIEKIFNMLKWQILYDDGV